MTPKQPGAQSAPSIVVPSTPGMGNPPSQQGGVMPSSNLGVTAGPSTTSGSSVPFSSLGPVPAVIIGQSGSAGAPGMIGMAGTSGTSFQRS